MPEQKVIDRETYRKVKKMSREELQAFLMRYAENLIEELDAESDVPIIDLKALESQPVLVSVIFQILLKVSAIPATICY